MTNIERFDLKIHGTADSLLAEIKNNEKEISPSTVYCRAPPPTFQYHQWCSPSEILEHCYYINGSPQNTFVPGVMKMIKEKELF